LIDYTKSEDIHMPSDFWRELVASMLCPINPRWRQHISPKHPP